MKILIVYAHPEPSSFNHALKEAAIDIFKQEQHDTKVSDLYAMQFNPVANWSDFKSINPELPKQFGIIQSDAVLNNQLSDDIKLEQEKLSWADIILFQFPLWWFSAPAILKGWLDRVLAAGYAYDKEHLFTTGFLNPKKAIISVTTQSPMSAYQADGRHGNIMQYLKSFHHTLRFVGITPLEPFVAYGVMNIDDAARKKYISDYKVHLIRQIKP